MVFPVPVFSAIDAVWLLVIDISTSVTVAVTVIVSELAPSVTDRMTVQTLALFPAPQPGASKFGALENVSAPEFETMLNRSWSIEPALSSVSRIE